MKCVRILRYVLICSLFGILFSSCTPDEMEDMEPDQESEGSSISISSPLQYSFTAGVTDYAAVADNEIIWSYTSYSEDDGASIWGSSIEEDEGLGIGFDLGPYNVAPEDISASDFLWLFSPGEYPLVPDGETGFTLFVSDTNGEYASDLGDQTNGTLEIIDSEEEYIGSIQYVKVHFAFDCNVYNVANPSDSIHIENGHFVNLFTR